MLDDTRSSGRSRKVGRSRGAKANLRKREYPPLEYSSLPEAFFKKARMNSEKTFEIFKYKGSWFSRSFKEGGHRVSALAGALIKHGVGKGDRVALISQTRSEWTLSDLAIQSVGAVTVPVYPNISPETVSFILKDSDAKLIFVERENMLNDVKIPDTVKSIVVFDGDGKEGFIPFSKFEELGEEKKDSIDLDSITLDDVATIVYTSGTTGLPKGVILTHGNILSVASATTKVIVPKEDDIIFAWLPFSHIFGRLIIFYAVYNAVTVAYAESIVRILDNLADVRPTLFPSVPRIYEKAYERIKARASQTPAKKKIFEFAERIAGIWVEYVRNQEPPPPHVVAMYKVADKLVFSKIRQAFGGRIRLCISGGASLPPHVAKFFIGAGVPILEGYGLTETASVVAVNRENKFKIGSIGLPIPYVEVRVADDGELLIKTPSMTPGYFKRERETEELFTEDGWLRTGDLVEMDDEGFIFFKGRKKNIIVSSFGKNIAPEPIELEIQKDPLVESVAIFGDDKPYLVALISLNREELMNFARERGIDGGKKPEELVNHPSVREHIKKVIDKVNSKRPSYERISKFEIVPEQWTSETGELTPTLKVKKYHIYEKYRNLIESMYK